MMAALENFLLIKRGPQNATPGASATGPHPSPLTTQPLKKMLILGDMLELGPTSLAEHQKVVNMLQDAGMEHVWLVGHEFAKTQNTYRHFDNVDEVKAELQANRPEGCLILIKGSNSTRLHQLPPLL